jgi:hypothetical protein
LRINVVEDIENQRGDGRRHNQGWFGCLQERNCMCACERIECVCNYYSSLEIKEDGSETGGVESKIDVRF